MARTIAGLVFSSIILLAGVPRGRAQSEDTALARRLFEQGIALADQREWSQAADRFRRSLDVRPSAVVAYNLGSVLVELGELVAASEAFERAMRSPGVESSVRTAAQARVAEIRPRIGSIVIEIEGTLTEDVEVRIDERPIPRQAIGVEVPADPGERAVDARRGGEVVASGTVDVAANAVSRISLSIPDAPEPEVEEEVAARPAAVLDPSANDDGGSIIASPWLWLGVGAAVAAGVAVLLVVLLADPGQASPIAGTLQPGVIEF